MMAEGNAERLMSSPRFRTIWDRWVAEAMTGGVAAGDSEHEHEKEPPGGQAQRLNGNRDAAVSTARSEQVNDTSRYLPDAD